jgi:hypothetical protein
MHLFDELHYPKVPTSVGVEIPQDYKQVKYVAKVTCGRSVVSSTNKTDRHDITEILLKVALNTLTLI